MVKLGAGAGDLGIGVNVLTPMGRGCMPLTPPVRGARATHTLLPNLLSILTPPFILTIYILVLMVGWHSWARPRVTWGEG